MAYTAAVHKCLPQMNACAVRVCKLDLDGSTFIGSTSAYATPAVVSLGFTPVFDAGAEVKEKDACGRTFIDVLADPTLTRYDVDMEFWSTDPNLLDIIIPDGDLLTRPTTGAVGFAYPAPGAVTGQFSLEFWAKLINDNNQDPDFPWAWWAIPYLKNVQMQKRDVNGTAVSKTTLKAEAYVNTNWFNGPADDWDVASDKPIQWIPTTALPTMDCTPDSISS